MVYSSSEEGFVNKHSSEVEKQIRWVKSWPPPKAVAQLNGASIFTSTHNFSSSKHKINRDAGNGENSSKSVLLLPQQPDAVRGEEQKYKR